MNKLESLTKKHFAEIAINKNGVYDCPKSIAFWFQKRIRKIALEYVEKRKDNKFGHIADIGCGRGDFTVEIAKTFPDTSVVGVDFVPQMLLLANQNRYKYFMSKKINFIAAKGEVLPFKDKSIDVLFCMNTLHHIEPSMASSFLSEICRITNKMIVLEYKNTKELYTRYIKKLRIKKILKLETYYYEMSFVLEKLEQNGFTSVVSRGTLGLEILSPICALFAWRKRA